MKLKCIPFYLDNNSNNLPFYILKDRKGNDIIYINEENMIYTNTKGINIGEQLNLFSKCFNQGICSIYKINENITVLKKWIKNDIYWYISTNDDYFLIYHDKYDHLEGVNIHFNDNYLCLTSYEYGECIPDVVAGYDINSNKLLDCDDYTTTNNLYKSLVEIRRCRFDLVCSILKCRVLIKDVDRLYQFLSFIFNKKIDKDNYLDYMLKARNYILKKYPMLENIDIPNNIDDISNKNKDFGINYFYFNRIDSKYDNLKYVSSKKKSKSI